MPDENIQTATKLLETDEACAMTVKETVQLVEFS